tara:strand:+ start:3821 stop:4675 length:855 start_codon:yes stop_codon:yes gene_type:complete
MRFEIAIFRPTSTFDHAFGRGLDMGDMTYIKVQRDDELAIVSIDRQEKLNALNAEVVQELGEIFTRLGDDDTVRAVILRGAGEKAFVAGADIGELSTMSSMSGVAVSRAGQEVFRAIELFPKPVIASISGYALGGGCELALACHLRVASEKARFGLPEVGLGIIPGYGGTVRLTRLVGLGRAIELTLSGEVIGAERAQAIGLVTLVAKPDALMDEAKSLARKITKNGPIAVRLALESIYRALDTETEAALGFESSAFGLLASTEDMKEGMRAFLDKRKAEFKGL